MCPLSNLRISGMLRGSPQSISIAVSPRDKLLAVACTSTCVGVVVTVHDVCENIPRAIVMLSSNAAARSGHPPPVASHVGTVNGRAATCGGGGDAPRHLAQERGELAPLRQGLGVQKISLFERSQASTNIRVDEQGDRANALFCPHATGLSPRDAGSGRIRLGRSPRRTQGRPRSGSGDRSETRCAPSLAGPVVLDA
jgi:hypothetical protein